MTVKPIIFNTYMVRDILDNRKTATRRVIKPQPPKDIEYIAFNANVYCAISWSEKGLRKKARPPYQPDDILYVRETWAKTEQFGLCDGYIYKADWKEDYEEIISIPKWHPSIHMPKEAARIWLKVTDVRWERLNDMTVDDAIKEGVDTSGIITKQGIIKYRVWNRMQGLWDFNIKKKDLDKYGWDANPWVWVIEFERVEKPDK